MAIKTDNGMLEAKLSVRRHILSKYHSDPLRVFDCCQGSGVIWDILRKEYQVASYWGVDLKKQKGRLKADSSSLLNQKGWQEDVVDVDTYGMPWTHWFSIVENFEHPVSVFLTIGSTNIGSDCKSLDEIVFGDKQFARSIPRMIRQHVYESIADEIAIFAGAERFGWNVLDAVVSRGLRKTRYIGVRIER